MEIAGIVHPDQCAVAGPHCLSQSHRFQRKQEKQTHVLHFMSLLGPKGRRMYFHAQKAEMAGKGLNVISQPNPYTC